MPGYYVGGTTSAIATVIGGNVVLQLPDLADGNKAPWVVVGFSEAVASYVRLGLVGDTMSAISQGVMVSRNAPMPAFFTGAYTHIHCWDQDGSIALLTVTPLSQAPI